MLGMAGFAMKRWTLEDLAELDAKDPQWWPLFLAEIVDGENPAELAHNRAWSFGALYSAIRADPVRSAAYDDAMRARAERHMLDLVPIADAAADDPDAVPGAKLRIEARARVASKWDRERYGERSKVEHEHRHTFEFDALGDVSGLLKRLRERDVTPAIAALPQHDDSQDI